MEMMRKVHGLVLAAGKGTRMGSPLPKPLVPLNGKPLLGHLLDAFEATGLEGISVVVGHQGELVAEHVGDRAHCIWQRERLGTAHAVACALEELQSKAEHLLVFVGDSPLLQAATIERLTAHHLVTESACTFLTATFLEPFPYARVLMDAEGNVVKCVEERDATEEEKKVREYLSSHFIFKLQALRDHLPSIQAHPRTGERYLTDMIPLLMAAGQQVSACPIEDYRELVGLNTPQDLAWAETYLNTHTV